MTFMRKLFLKKCSSAKLQGTDFFLFTPGQQIISHTRKMTVFTCSDVILYVAERFLRKFQSIVENVMKIS